jgi:hypothetical protein
MRTTGKPLPAADVGSATFGADARGAQDVSSGEVRYLLRGDSNRQSRAGRCQACATPPQRLLPRTATWRPSRLSCFDESAGRCRHQITLPGAALNSSVEFAPCRSASPGAVERGSLRSTFAACGRGASGGFGSNSVGSS